MGNSCCAWCARVCCCCPCCCCCCCCREEQPLLKSPRRPSEEQPILTVLPDPTGNSETQEMKFKLHSDNISEDWEPPAGGGTKGKEPPGGVGKTKGKEPPGGVGKTKGKEPPGGVGKTKGKEPPGRVGKTKSKESAPTSPQRKPLLSSQSPDEVTSPSRTFVRGGTGKASWRLTPTPTPSGGGGGGRETASATVTFQEGNATQEELQDFILMSQELEGADLGEMQVSKSFTISFQGITEN